MLDKKILVIRDSREKAGWDFPKTDRCEGTKVATLKTGDYSISGLEDVFTLERKASVAEVASNLFDERFERELVRLDDFDHPFLFLEFTLDDLMRFPEGSGIPKSRWASLRVTPQLLLKRLHELALDHPKIQIQYVGSRGREAASSLFKRVHERYGPA